MKILIWFALSLFAAVLYRLGGHFQTKIRDLGVPVAATALLLLIGLKAPWWAFVAHFGLLFVALTTYWKQKGTDAHWWNWALTGLGYSLAALPIAIATGHYLGLGIRTILLTGLIILWSEKVGEVNLEEGGRGFLTVATLPLLLI